MSLDFMFQMDKHLLSEIAERWGRGVNSFGLKSHTLQPAVSKFLSTQDFSN